MKQFKLILFLITSIGIYFISYSSFALPTEKNDFLLTPESEEYKTNGINRVKNISNSGGHVRDQYNKEAYDIGGADKKNINSVGEQMATGILNRNSLIDYIVYALKTLSQLAIFIGAVMFIYNGYQYASFALTNTQPKKENLTNAIIGILVVIFSYAIMRILMSMFIT